MSCEPLMHAIRDLINEMRLLREALGRSEHRTPESVRLFDEPTPDIKAGWPYTLADKQRRIALIDIEREIKTYEAALVPLTIGASMTLYKRLEQNVVNMPFDLEPNLRPNAFAMTKETLDLIAKWNEYKWYCSLMTRLRRICE